MQYVDIILAIFLIFGTVKGFKNGFFVEIASLLALVLGVYGAIKFSYFINNYLSGRVDLEERYIGIISFALTFIIIVIGISWLGKVLTKVADITMLGFVNKVLGAVFGGLKTALILSVVLLIFSNLNSSFSLLDKESLEKSILYKPVKSIVPLLFPSVVKENSNGLSIEVKL